MERIFISYDRDDQAVAQSIYDDLLGRPDIDPWLDVKRLKIVRFDPECLKLIEQSSYVLALVSPASVTSTGFVAKEWDHAIAKQRRVLPFLLDAAVEDDPQTAHVLREFDAISWVRGYESLKEGLRKVLREIYGDLAQGTFRETFSSLGPDNIGWRLDGWNLVDEDASEQNSQSLHAEVAPTFASQNHECAAAIPLTLGEWSRIAYARRLKLHRAHIGAGARFQVTIGDGTHVAVVEEIDLTGSRLDHDDGDWRLVELPLDLDRLRGRNATLRFTLSAADVLPMPLTRGEAGIDNIWID